MYQKLTLSLLCFSAFMGCAHISKKDCLEKDWIKVGQSDGAAGKFAVNMEKVASSCGRFEMANPPQSQYQMGYDLGLKEYCTTDLALGKGRDGLEIPEVCPESRFEEMLAAWKSGIKSFCNHENGKSNGTDGLAKNRFCSESENPKYFEGYKQGAKSYCSHTRKAFELGKSGKLSLVECPSELRGAFEDAYEDGKGVKIEMDRLKSQIAKLDSKISSLNREIASLDREVIQAQEKVQRSDWRINDLNGRIRDLDRQIARDSHPSYNQGRRDQLRNELNREYLNGSSSMNFELSNLQSRRTTRTFANTLLIHEYRREKAALERDLRELERR